MIIFIDVLQILAVCGVLFILVTQIIVPTWQGQPLFPWHNNRRRRLEEKLKALKEQQELDQLEQMVDTLEKKKEKPNEPIEHSENPDTRN